MTKKTVSAKTRRQFVVRSTKASAGLEHRVVPPDHVRSAKVEKFVESLRMKRAWIAEHVAAEIVGGGVVVGRASGSDFARAEGAGVEQVLGLHRAVSHGDDGGARI